MPVPSSGAPAPLWRRGLRSLAALLPRLGVALASIVICDLVATAALGRLGWYHPPESYRVRHPVYHHGLEPLVEGRPAEWGRLRYRVSTNSLGMRDARARTVPLRAEGARVLLLGDSFTEGLGYSYEATFAGRLASELEGRGVELLNAAVVSYSPTVYLAKTRHWLVDQGLEVDHLVVALDLSDVYDEARIYLPEDGAGGVRAADDAMDRVRSFIRRRTILINALNQLNRMRRRSRPGLQVGAPRGRWACDSAAMELYGREGLRRAERRLAELAELAESRGVGLTLVVYPWPDQLAARDLDSVQRIHWREWASRRGVGFVDLFPVFFDAGPAEQVLAEMFIPNDVHWSDAGHRLVAQALAAALQEGPLAGLAGLGEDP